MALAEIRPHTPVVGTFVRDGAIVHPVGVPSVWVTLCSDPFAADNAGSEVIAPLALTRAALTKMVVEGSGTTLLLCLQYRPNIVVSTQVVVQAFGIDANGKPHRLRNAAGTHALTLTVAATDVGDGTDEYTDPVEVDLEGSEKVLVVVKTALVISSGTATAAILGKLK